MTAHRIGLKSMAFAVALACCGMALGQDQQALPFEPMHRSGMNVTGAMEGWFPNDDGTFSILVGYYNRNLRESVDIPVGSNNKIEPGAPDQGQPTHFRPGRSWAVLTVKVPKDFGEKSLTWTIVTNGVSASIPLNLLPLYRVAPYMDANNDTPPYIGFTEDGPFVNGPPVGHTESLNATVGTPLPLTVWVADDANDNVLPGTPVAKKRGEDNAKQPVTMEWDMYRGPGAVKFDKEKPVPEKVDLKSPPPGTVFYGKVTNTATFSAPGQYVLTVQAFDSTGIGGDGFECCWTTAKVNVSVVPAAGGTE